MFRGCLGGYLFVCMAPPHPASPEAMFDGEFLSGYFGAEPEAKRTASCGHCPRRHMCKLCGPGQATLAHSGVFGMDLPCDFPESSDEEPRVKGGKGKKRETTNESSPGDKQPKVPFEELERKAQRKRKAAAALDLQRKKQAARAGEKPAKASEVEEFDPKALQKQAPSPRLPRCKSVQIPSRCSPVFLWRPTTRPRRSWPRTRPPPRQRSPSPRQAKYPAQDRAVKRHRWSSIERSACYVQTRRQGKGGPISTPVFLRRGGGRQGVEGRGAPPRARHDQARGHDGGHPQEGQQGGPPTAIPPQEEDLAHTERPRGVTRRAH